MPRARSTASASTSSTSELLGRRALNRALLAASSCSSGRRCRRSRPPNTRPGTVLVDGFVAATWEQAVQAGVTTLAIEPLRRLSRREAAAVAAEGRRLLRWAAPGREHRVAVGPPA